MKELEMLEMEIKLLQDNIERLKQFAKDNDNFKWKPYSSNVVGEFKHRLISLKQRITLVSKITTSDIFKNK